MKKIAFFTLLASLFLSACTQDKQILWQLGENDNSGAEFALAPGGYKDYIAN
jgi:hypothetical protein